METLYVWIVRFPWVAQLLGKALGSVGLLLVLAGSQGRRVLRMFDSRLTRVGVAAPDSLAEAYPMLPTWWIPETWIGFTLAALLLMAGWMLMRLAKDAMKYR